MKKQNKKDKDNGTQIVEIKEKAKFSEIITKKWLRKTPLTILLIIIIIGAYVLLNFGVNKANLSNIDLTPEKIYSLSESSKSISKSVEKEVNITLINMDFSKSIIEQYERENNKIKVQELKDINTRPDLVSKYNLRDDSAMIIMECGEKQKILVSSDLYTWDYTTGDQKDITEEAITNAILDLTIEKKPKIYYLTGHEEYSAEYMYYFKQDLTKEANEVIDLDLLTKSKVPEDCDALIITTLKNDLKDAERDVLIDYIKRGGKIILFADPNIGNLKLPNFQKVLDEYGVSISNGVILEQDTNKMLANASFAIIATVSPSSSVTDRANMNMNACFINSGKITLKETQELEKLGVTSETLATASEKAFYREDITIQSTSKTSADKEDPNAILGALLTKKIDENTQSKLIVYANNVFVSNVQLTLSPQSYSYALDLYNNKDLALNSISYLTGRDDTIVIRKNTDVTTYTVSEQQRTIILSIIFAVPVIIIIVGLIVWQVRRRKK